MNSIIKTDFKRVFVSSGIYVSSIIVFMLLLQEGLATGLVEAAADGFGGAHGNTSVDLFGMTVFFSSLILLAPLLCTLPYSASYCDEYNNHYSYYFMHRSHSYREYAVSKLLVTKICGGLAIFVPMLLYGVICQLLAVPVDLSKNTVSNLSTSIWSLVNTNGGFLYIFVQSFFFGLFGSACALVSLAVSVYVPNKYIVYALPLILCYTMNYIFSRYNISFLSPFQSFDPARTYFNNTNAIWGYVYMLGYQAIVFLISSLAFIQGIKRRVHFG